MTYHQPHPMYHRAAVDLDWDAEDGTHYAVSLYSEPVDTYIPKSQKITLAVERGTNGLVMGRIYGMTSHGLGAFDLSNKEIRRTVHVEFDRQGLAQWTPREVYDILLDEGWEEIRRKIVTSHGQESLLTRDHPALEDRLDG